MTQVTHLVRPDGRASVRPPRHEHRRRPVASSRRSAGRTSRPGTSSIRSCSRRCTACSTRRDAFKAAHWLNGFLMCQHRRSRPTCSHAPAGTSKLAGYVVAALSVCVPWLALGDMLRDDAVAYPAFTWARARDAARAGRAPARAARRSPSPRSWSPRSRARSSLSSRPHSLSPSCSTTGSCGSCRCRRPSRAELLLGCGTRWPARRDDRASACSTGSRAASARCSAAISPRRPPATCSRLVSPATSPCTSRSWPSESACCRSPSRRAGRSRAWYDPPTAAGTRTPCCCWWSAWSSCGHQLVRAAKRRRQCLRPILLLSRPARPGRNGAVHR